MDAVIATPKDTPAMSSMKDYQWACGALAGALLLCLTLALLGMNVDFAEGANGPAAIAFLCCCLVSKANRSYVSQYRVLDG